MPCLFEHKALRTEINRAVRDIEASFARSEGNFNAALDSAVTALSTRNDNLTIAVERNVADYQTLIQKTAEKETELAARDNDMDQRVRSLIYNSEEKFLRQAEQNGFDLRVIFFQYFFLKKIFNDFS